MNTLFITRGLPSSGKSTFLKECGFTPFVIEPDQIRMLFGGIEYKDNKWGIPQRYDKKVWALVDTLLCHRLKKGIVTFLDATNIKRKYLDHYKELCDKYGAELIIIDFTDIDLETVKERNSKREDYKIVPEEVIDTMYKQLQETSLIGYKVVNPKEVEHLVFKLQPVNKVSKATPEIEALNESELIRKKDLGNNIVSYNFTRDAFFHSAWDKQTVTARGLFIDTENNKIIARSYNKFFAIEERPETQWDNLKDTLKFPVACYVKENGFLGIVSYDYKNDDLFIASKSTNQGEYAENFKRILLKELGDKKEVLKKTLKEENCSAIFECIDPVNDPHIIEYAKEQVVLLDVVQNDFTNTFKSYEFIKTLSVDIGIPCKQLVKVFNSFEEMKEFIDKKDYIISPFDQAGDIEGYVFVDSNEYMLKYKTGFYKYWKNIRKLKDMITTGKEIKGKLDEWDNIVMKYMNNTYTPEELSNKSVIEIRNGLLNERVAYGL